MPGLAAVLAACAFSRPVVADTVDNWQGEQYDNLWSDAYNWTQYYPAGIGDEDDANITASGSPYNVVFDYMGSYVDPESGNEIYEPLHVIGVMTIDLTGGASGLASTLVMSDSNSLQCQTEIVGNNGAGEINQSAGSNSVNPGGSYDGNGGNLILGQNSGSNGTYVLSGGALIVYGTADEYIGSGGSGTFNQSGGTNTIDNGGGVGIGYQSGATGTYNLSGSGSLSSSNIEFVGYAGHGFFNQTGSSINLINTGTEKSLSIGEGTYNLDGSASLMASGWEVIGDAGSGADVAPAGYFVQNGGSNAVGTAGDSYLIVGSDASSGEAQYTLNAGSLSVNGFEEIGSDGAGTFTQTGGTNTDSNYAISIGVYGEYENYPSGIYNLSGTGALSALVENVGADGLGSFNQSGGTNITGGLVLGLDSGAAQGTFLLSGGSLSITGGGFEQIGDKGHGIFSQSGGTNTVTGGIILADFFGTSGTYTLSGGTASAPNIYVGGGVSSAGGQGIFTVEGGALTVTNTLEVYNASVNALNFSSGTITASALNFNNNPALFNWTGGALQLTSSFNVSVLGSAVTLGSNQTLGVTGTETLGSTLTLNSGSMNTVSGGVAVTSQGFLSIAGGALSAASLTGTGGLSVTAGTLSLSTLAPTQTTMTVAGGTVTVGSVSLTVGGVINVSGGTLSAGTISITPSGAISESKGTVNATTLTLDGGYTYTGGSHSISSINIGSSGVLGGSSFTLNSTEALALSSGGTISTSSFSIAAGGSASQNGGTISSPLVGVEGDLSFISGTLTPSVLDVEQGGLFSLTNAWTNASSMQVEAGGNVQLSSALTNNSVIQVLSGGLIFGSASITNNSAGLISGAGTISAGISNGGTIEPIGGLLSLTGAVNNTGAVNVPVGTEALFSNMTYNPGTLTLNGGTIDTNGTTLHNVSQISGYGVLRTGGLTNDGTIALAGQTSVYGSVTNNSDGLIHLSGNSLSVFYGTVANGGMLNIDAGASGSLYGAYSGSGSIVDNGTLYLNANSVAGHISGSGNLTIGSTSSGPAVVQLIPGSGLSQQGALTIASNSKFDITNNNFIINYGSGPDPIASIAALIASGYAGGTWAGNGIMSTTAQSNSASYGIGYADSADPGNPAGLASDQIEIKYTLLGDANLDGKVNGSDFTLMASHFNDAVTNGWDEGDFNYSGTVNGADFVLLADNFNQFASQSAVSAADLAALDTFAAANGISLTSVPEPSLIGMLLPISVCATLLARRRAISSSVYTLAR